VAEHADRAGDDPFPGVLPLAGVGVRVPGDLDAARAAPLSGSHSASVVRHFVKSREPAAGVSCGRLWCLGEWQSHITPCGGMGRGQPAFSIFGLTGSAGRSPRNGTPRWSPLAGFIRAVKTRRKLP
jgi:hypothetical protein